MFRPNGFADLADRRVGVWGIGVEGRATLERIRAIAGSVVLVDDTADDAHGVLGTNLGGLEALQSCDVVLKSPGISRYRDDVAQLLSAGVTVTSALNLWMNEVDPARVIAVTGTKGKSTTTSLITFFLRALGENAHSAGNIGTPPYDKSFATDGWVVLEVSSFQSVEFERAPRVVVVTALGSDHLDWHGSLSQYHADKLAITRASGDHTTVVSSDVTSAAAAAMIGGQLRVIDSRDNELARALHLLGAHNAVNVELALEAVGVATGISRDDVRGRVSLVASNFEALPGRLTLVRTLNGVRYVDDGLATAPLPTIAALDVFSNEPVALIVGGYDRGVDYAPLGDALARRHAATTLITMPDAGERIAASVLERASMTVVAASNMLEAVEAARRSLNSDGVVLLSPAAASFGQYTNWRERSDDFTNVVLSLSD